MHTPSGSPRGILSPVQPIERSPGDHVPQPEPDSPGPPGKKPLGRFWRALGTVVFVFLGLLAGLLVFVPQPHSPGPDLPGPATAPVPSGETHWQPTRSVSPLKVHFGWGIRDRIWVLAEPILEWSSELFNRLQAKLLGGGNLTTEMGTREIVYELAEKDQREVEIIKIAPFVEQLIGVGTKEAARHPYWVTQGIVDLKRTVPEQIRDDSYPPLVLGFIIDGVSGARYVVPADVLARFLKNPDLSLIQNQDVFDTHLLRYSNQDLHHR
jgi:hypothetical protein